MVGGEPTLVFWRVQDLLEALKAADDMGLPVTSPKSVADTVLTRLLLFGLADAEDET